MANTPYEEYIKGLNEGWELARKLRYDFRPEDVIKIFNLKLQHEVIAPICHVMCEYSGQEAMKAYKAWEDTTKPQLGSIVKRIRNGKKGVILDFAEEGLASVFTEDGLVEGWELRHVELTDKKIDGLTDWLIAAAQDAK